jgi:hypothetical protein
MHAMQVKAFSFLVEINTKTLHKHPQNLAQVNYTDKFMQMVLMIVIKNIGCILSH